MRPARVPSPRGSSPSSRTCNANQYLDPRRKRKKKQPFSTRAIITEKEESQPRDQPNRPGDSLMRFKSIHWSVRGVQLEQAPGLWASRAGTVGADVQWASRPLSEASGGPGPLTSAMPSVAGGPSALNGARRGSIRDLSKLSLC